MLQLTLHKTGPRHLSGENLILGLLSLSLSVGQNYTKISSFSSCSELNDTIVEAQLRTRQEPPGLPTQTTIDRYLQSKNRLIILVPFFQFFNSLARMLFMVRYINFFCALYKLGV